MYYRHYEGATDLMDFTDSHYCWEKNLCKKI